MLTSMQTNMEDSLDYLYTGIRSGANRTADIQKMFTLELDKLDVESSPNSF